jgi:hypothetical protein
VNSQKDTPDATHTPREVMRPASITSPEASSVPQKPEKNVYGNVTTLNVLNNSGIAATSAEQDDRYENYYSIPGRYLKNNSIQFRILVLLCRIQQPYGQLQKEHRDIRKVQNN